MRKFGILFFCLIQLLITNTVLHAQKQVITSLDTSNYLVGDPIKLELKVPDVLDRIISIRSDSTKYSLPDNMELLSWPKWKKETLNAINYWKASCIIAVYDSGKFDIPSIPITVETRSGKETIYTSKVPVLVKTLAVSDTTSLAPIKNIITTPKSWKDQLPWILAILVFILIILFAIYFIKKRAKKLPKPSLPLTPLAAYDIAKTKLLRLRELELWKKNKVLEYQTELTEIIRQYVNDRYGIPALQMSSEEILESLKSTLKDKKTSKTLGNLLEVADYVKFAKAIPPDKIHEHVMEIAEDFLEKTKG